MSKVLIVDDERSICETLSEIVSLEGHQALTAGSAREGLALVESARPALVFLDVRLPDLSGVEALREIKRLRPRTAVIVITAYGSVSTAMDAMRAGAFEYLGKPLDLERVRGLLRRGLREAEQDPGPADAAPATADAGEQPELIGQSPAMQEVFKLMGLLTANDLTVLITGESGVGKELVARGIHENGPRASLPFVAINCAAIPASLLESELFGHERGAFTGAAERRVGRCEAAGGGSLFLDEIGELPLELQGKLLRVLQERRFERVGNMSPIPLDARVLVATNRDLRGEVSAGRFREDLFHRINLVHLEIPPLRNRSEDIPLLARHFLSLANNELGARVEGFEPAAMLRLKSQTWPGNVRELENAIKKMVLINRSRWITADDIEPGAANGDSMRTANDDAAGLEPLRASVRDTLRALVSGEPQDRQGSAFHTITAAVEEEIVAEALRLTGGNQVAASRSLGVSRTTLRKKLGH